MVSSYLHEWALSFKNGYLKWLLEEVFIAHTPNKNQLRNNRGFGNVFMWWSKNLAWAGHRTACWKTSFTITTYYYCHAYYQLEVCFSLIFSPYYFHPAVEKRSFLHRYKMFSVLCFCKLCKL